MRKDTARPGRPFERVLIANRGEIALRVMRACRELDIETVAVYSDADVEARHVRLADSAVRIGPPPAADSYLRVDAIVEAARASGAQAVHPGYGFLSERAELAEACAAVGIVFVGPTPETLRSLGDKLAARAAAIAADVPVVPGTLEPVAVGGDGPVDELLAEAERVGWPLLVKAAGGGGGRGMRRVASPTELVDTLVSASREAEAAFGDGAVYLERYVEGARHVEVQLLGDGEGNVVAVGERDCSVQRRHQKLVEEAPAPGMSTDQRERLHEMAVRLARGVGLRNAATAEFLLSPAGELWFLEVNARLQVEHGVTELVTGIDLVREQLWLAAGWPLGAEVLAAAATATRPDRHAIEVRLSAEDPGNDFAPFPGMIRRWHEPAGPGVRVDGGVEEGSAVTADYDPLLAKLLVVDTDRPAAIARMSRALDEFVIGGVQTTLPFHRWLLDQPEFTTTDGLSTDLVARRWAPAPIAARAALRAAELAATAASRAEALRPAEPSTAGQAAAERWWQAGVAEALEQRP